MRLAATLAVALLALAPLDARASDGGPAEPDAPNVEGAPAPAPAPAVVDVPAPAPSLGTLQELRGGDVEQDTGGRFMGLVGCAFLIALAWALSTDRRRVSWRLVGMGLALQLGFALIVLKTALGRRLFDVTNDAVKRLLSFSRDGAKFLFGNLVDMAVPVVGPDGAVTGSLAQTGALFAFGVLPTILFFSAMSAVLYHLNILPVVVKGIASVMRRSMGTSGAESLSAAANIFVGQTEAPLLVRPFLPKMTRSEMMAVMSGGFATVAGGVMAAYVGMLEGVFPDIAGHLVAASVMSAPASLVIAKIMVPETGTPETAGGADVKVEKLDVNVLDAASRGTSEGVTLALNVGAMLIVFTALIPLIDWILQAPALGFDLVGLEGLRDAFSSLTLQRVFGWVFAPLAFLLGVPWDDAAAIGALMGTKTVINEFVAYLQLAGSLADGSIQHGKSVIIATYALCGFSNLASIGIQIGGLSVIAPQRRRDLADIGFRAMIAGSLACFMTAAVAGVLL